MPNWKKVITSGSNASLGTLYVSGTISGPNANISIGSTAVALGATVTNLPGMGTITAASFVGPLTGNASTATNATQVNTGVVTTNATHYLTYVPDNNLSPATEALGTVAALTYNPNSGHFKAPTVSGSTAVYSAGDVTAAQNLRSINSSGDEGGEIFLNKAVTNTTLTGGVTIDVWQNRLRFFEQGGTARGYYLDISAGGAGVGTNLASGGGTVTSVATAGTVSGITLTGGTITGAGTITLGGSISGLTTSNLSSTAGITNAQLAKPSLRIGVTDFVLGATGSAVTGLTSVGADTFTGYVNAGSVITMASGISIAAINSTVGISGSLYLPNISNTTATNVLYYNPTTKVVTHATAPAGSVTSIATAGSVNGITLTGGTITSTGTITLGGTLSGIGNAQLTNSAVTVGSTSISLGSSATTIAGLSSVTSTTFVGAVTGNASTSTIASTANNVVITNTTTSGGGPFYPLFSAIASGTGSILADNTTFLYTPTTNTLSVTSSYANEALTATTANATTAALTAGTYLTSGGTFNGSTARTFAVDATSANTVSKVVARDSSGNFSAGTITATLSGNASTATSASFATTANNANLVNITTQDTTPVTYNVTFTGGASGYNALNVDATTLTYNPSTTTLTTGTFSGALSGNASTATTATNATNTAITDTTTGAGPYYLTFVSGTSSNQAQRVDSSGLTYNATSNAVTASWFKGDLVGNASTATQVRVLAAGGAFDIGGSAYGAGGSESELYTDPTRFTYNPALGQLYISDAGGNKMYHGVDPAGYGYVQSQAVSGQYVIGSNTIAFYDGLLAAYQGQFVGGNFDAAQDITCGGTKFFDIPHQTKQGWGLKHGAIEGPESGVYFRGKLNGSDKIELPEYWQWLVREDTITVSLTPVGQYQTLYVKDIKDNKVYIGSDNDYVNCHYVVYGERADVEKWDAEYESYSRGEK